MLDLGRWRYDRRPIGPAGVRLRCRTNLKLSQFGLLGEIGSGAVGGVVATWNTPIETVQVLMQKDVC